MAQYTSTTTSSDGTVTNSVLNSVTNEQTITVTAPTGQVATATVNAGDVDSNLDNIIANLARQLEEQGAGGGTGVGLRGITNGVTSTSSNVTQQQQTATAEARATNTTPPAEKQAIPVSTVTNPQVPQPTDKNPPPTTTAPATVPPQSVNPVAQTQTTVDEFGQVVAVETADPVEDPYETERLRAEQSLSDPPPTLTAEDVRDEDPFEAERLRAEQELANQEPTVYSPADLGVEELTPEQLAQQEEAQRLNREALSREDVRDAAITAAFKEKAKQQATFQARYKQQGNQDWRVRLSLSPNAQYLYNAGTPRGSGAGILAPLAKTDGVIFPYTPSITTTYTANYEQYDLVHSNYRGVFYKNSRVGDISIRGTFTAQDTNEANYLLAVIHFFRSATKMFYGQDAERGTPPPVCLLNGLGQYQFSDHPVVISSFNYTTPNDVDYIRATNPNNFGSNLLNRRSAVASNPGGASLAGLNRLLNAVQNGLSKGAIPNTPAPGSVTQSVNNTAGATYVPTKMEVDITLIPVQTRSQVSKQFSLKGFANGDLLKGGFW